MDSAVGLVQAYLYANGYFTVTEYPVIEAMKHGQYRTATDIDVLAVRFPGAGRLLPHHSAKPSRGRTLTIVDEALRPPSDRIDMIVAEVKEGKAELNRGARSRSVLSTALRRFGAFGPEDAHDVVDRLLATGTAIAPTGPQVRLMAFGSHHDTEVSHPYTIITLGHIVSFIRAFAAEHWRELRPAQLKDPTMSLLMVLMKAIRQDSELLHQLGEHGADAAE